MPFRLAFGNVVPRWATPRKGSFASENAEETGNSRKSKKIDLNINPLVVCGLHTEDINSTEMTEFPISGREVIVDWLSGPYAPGHCFAAVERTPHFRPLPKIVVTAVHAVSNLVYGAFSRNRLLPNMTLRRLLSFPAALRRHATGRRARIFGLALLVVLFVLVAVSSGIRVRSYFLTLRIQAVLLGLEHLEVDATPEEQLLRTVPYMTRVPLESRQGTQAYRYYRVSLSNEGDEKWLRWLRWTQFVSRVIPSLGPTLSDAGVADKWAFMDVPHKVASVFGWRHLSFGADVRVFDGKVSSIWYGIEPDVFVGWPVSYLVVTHSEHGLWRDRGLPVQVNDADDESPHYRFGFAAGQFSMLPGTESSIGVAFTDDATREPISHAFQLDLSCFWGVRGCGSVHQIAPLLWKDQQAIRAAAASRLKSQDPCPDRILADRVRYLPDLIVELFELTDSRPRGTADGNDAVGSLTAGYRLKETIWGSADRARLWERYEASIAWASDSREHVSPPELRTLKAGDKVLVFSGAKFNSCRVVPATPSAEAAVRAAVPAPRRLEDDVSGYWGRQ